MVAPYKGGRHQCELSCANAEGSYGIECDAGRYQVNTNMVLKSTACVVNADEQQNAESYGLISLPVARMSEGVPSNW